MSVDFFGRCTCCGDRVESSGGCSRCTSVRIFCAACGMLLTCGCGATIQHACPNVTLVETRTIFEVNIF